VTRSAKLRTIRFKEKSSEVWAMWRPPDMAKKGKIRRKVAGLRRQYPNFIFEMVAG
jgi:hypothetical protein